MRTSDQHPQGGVPIWKEQHFASGDSQWVGLPTDQEFGASPLQPVQSGTDSDGAVTRQTWTAFVSALAFICLAVLLVVVPVPFVSWSPGGTRDTLGNVGNEPMIKGQGIDTYPTTGRLDMTIVAITPADARLSLPQALLAYWLPHRDALPRDAVYARQISRAGGERGRRHDGDSSR